VTGARRALPHLGAAALIFSVAWLYNITQGINPQDESWFLQVTARAARGEVLYRDVAFGATPLSIYLSVLLVKLFGVEVVIIKALNALSFTVTLLLCVRCSEHLGLSRNTACAVGAAYLFYALPGNALLGSAYTPLAIMLFVACFERTLAWQRSPLVRTLLAAAVLAGLCFGVKQNMGLLAIVALAVVVGLRNARAAATACGIAALTTAVTLLPVMLTQAMPQFIDYGFTGKGTYVELGGISMLAGALRELRSGYLWRQMYWPHQYLFAPIAFVLLLLARPRDARATTLLVFSVAAFAAIFPRADAMHLTISHPLIILALAYGLHALLRERRQLVRRSVYVWLGAGLLAMTTARVRFLMSADLEISTLPHFRGPPVAHSFTSEVRRTSAELRAAAPTNELFLLSPRAGLYYLVSGLANPTPYDYPYATTFGAHGEAAVAAAVRQGNIFACVDPVGDSVLTAWVIRRAIENVSYCRVRR
jgi:hypothetical protein